MDRLQKKCVLASTGFHLSLLVILMVGPAFLMSRNKPDDTGPALTFIPMITTDDKVQGGGDPRGAAPPPPPPPAPRAADPEPPKPKPPEVKREEVREPDPPKDTVKPADKKPDPESLETATEKKEVKKRRPEVSTTIVTRPKDTDADKKARELAKERAERAQEEADAREAKEYEKRMADRRRTLANSFGSAVNSIKQGSAGSTTIVFDGPGGGGVPYANFLQGLKTIYENAWILPDGVTDNDATVAASVTIARDGTVVRSRVLRSSGNSSVDQSVQVTLRRVKMTLPLPAASKDDERTVTINFNVASKRGTG